MRHLFNAALWMIGLLTLLVFSFVFPIGRYTLFEHAQRIAATEPARELGDGLGEAGEALGDSARGEWDRRMTEASGDR
jgi:hypothetical protein